MLTGVGDGRWCGIGVARGVFGLWVFWFWRWNLPSEFGHQGHNDYFVFDSFQKFSLRKKSPVAHNARSTGHNARAKSQNSPP